MISKAICRLWWPQRLPKSSRTFIALVDAGRDNYLEKPCKKKFCLHQWVVNKNADIGEYR